MKDLFEPDLDSKKSYKKHMIIYLVFIIIVIISLTCYAIFSSLVNPWKKFFELKEIKTVLTASVGKNLSSKDFGIDFIKDFYFNFENKNINSKNSIKKICFKNIEILDETGKKPDFNIIIYQKDHNNKYVPLKEEQKNIIEYEITEPDKEIVLVFRTKNENLAQMQIDSNYEAKQRLSLLKDKINEENKKQINYIVKLNIEVELMNGKTFTTEQKIMPDNEINFDSNIFIKKVESDAHFDLIDKNNKN